MAYYLNLFSPNTHDSFSNSDRSISGFRISQRQIAERINPGDKFICYMTGLSRWVGVLAIESEAFVDETPFYYEEDDPFIVRFKVEPEVWLSAEEAIPIHNEEIWNTLTFTKEHSQSTSTWTGKLRSSLNRLDEDDAKFLEAALTRQSRDRVVFEIDEAKYKRLLTQRVRRPDKVVSVTVPEDADKSVDDTSIRESHRIQALLATVGEKMGFKIWIPRQDRGEVLKGWAPHEQSLVERLPLNYDETTIRTIEQIDVLWLRGRTIVRAFEVEHTTAVYSGILRMADLLALQPNMDIKLHLVAPSERRTKVFQEIQRPVFSLIERGPLNELCSFISYESLYELSELQQLAHMTDSVLDEFTELAGD